MQPLQQISISLRNIFLYIQILVESPSRTDGFGRSDTRAALRGYFGVDAHSVAQAARRMIHAG